MFCERVFCEQVYDEQVFGLTMRTGVRSVGIHSLWTNLWITMPCG